MQTIIKVRAPDGWTCIVAEDGGVFSAVQWRDVLDCVHESLAPSPGLREHPFRSPEAAMDAAYRERLSRDGPLRLRQEITNNLAKLAATFGAKRT